MQHLRPPGLRLRLLLATTIGLAGPLTASLPADPPHIEATVRLHADITLRLATPDEGAAVIGVADEWVKSFGPFDYKVRLQSDDAAGEAAFLEFARAQGRAWTPEEVEAVTTAASSIHDRLAAIGLRLDLPKEILIVKTTGREEGGMGGYTRGSIIVLSEAGLNDPQGIEHLLLHELFHVMTRHNPAIRQPLYRLIGFDHVGPLEYPAELVPRRITNPDAFHHDAFIEVEIEGKQVRLTPLTLSATPAYAGGGIGRNVVIEFLQVEVHDGRMVPVRLNEALVLIPLEDMPAEYFRKIGGNTRYVIHPEEIMADNFSLAVRQQRTVRTPALLDAIIKVLSDPESDA